MIRSFRLSGDAAQDIEEIWTHIADDSVPAASRFRRKLLDACRLLGANPHFGHKREDLVEDRPILFWPVDSYLILYRAGTKPIVIVAVTHGARNVPALLRRRGEI